MTSTLLRGARIVRRRRRALRRGTHHHRRERPARRGGARGRHARRRARRGPGRARPDARAHVRRPHGLPAHVREALRPEREARDRAAARRCPADDLGRQADDDDPHPPRHPLQRRHGARRRRREDLARPAPHARPLGARQRARPGLRGRGRRAAHGQAAPQRAVRPPDRAARRPGRDDHVAEAARGARRPVRDEPGVRRALPLRQPRGRRPDHAGEVDAVLRAEPRPPRPDRLPDHHGHERPRREPPLGRRAGARPHRVDRPAGDRPRPQPARDQGDVDRLPGDLVQHREQERARQAVRERRHAAGLAAAPAAGLRALDRPARDQPGRVRRDRPPRLPARAAHEPLLRPHHPLPGPQRRPGAVDHPAHRCGHARPGAPHDRHRPGGRRGSVR